MEEEWSDYVVTEHDCAKWETDTLNRLLGEKISSLDWAGPWETNVRKHPDFRYDPETRATTLYVEGPGDTIYPEPVLVTIGYTGERGE